MAIDESRTKVTILTGTYRIKGYIDLLPGARLTDYIVEAKDFVALTNAEVYEAVLGGRRRARLLSPSLNPGGPGLPIGRYVGIVGRDSLVRRPLPQAAVKKGQG